MDVPSVIKQRLADLGVEQRDLATAAQVTESYISQLLTRKKAPPAPNRTDIYDKMEHFLGLPRGELSTLADLQRQEALQRRLGDPLTPLFQDVRALILRKCPPDNATHIRTIFEKQPFGELERLVTQKLLEVVQRVAKEELAREPWLRQMACLSNRSYEQIRVMVLEFLDTDIFNLSGEHCVAFLDPLIESWDIDLATFGMEIVLNRRLASEPVKKFAFVERDPQEPFDEEPGLTAFLQDTSLSGDATEEEIALLRQLRFKGKRPTPLYYYREVQNFRDPLHFLSYPRRGEHRERWERGVADRRVVRRRHVIATTMTDWPKYSARRRRCYVGNRLYTHRRSAVLRYGYQDLARMGTGRHSPSRNIPSRAWARHHVGHSPD